MRNASRQRVYDILTLVDLAAILPFYLSMWIPIDRRFPDWLRQGTWTALQRDI